jgi:hypothetical protein
MNLLVRLLNTQFHLPGMLLNKIRSFQETDNFAPWTFCEMKRFKLAAVYVLCDGEYRSHFLGSSVCIHQMRRLTQQRHAGQRYNMGSWVT